jgi:hypothetical protein
LNTRVDGDDVGTFLGEPNCFGAALAASGSRDECDLAGVATCGHSVQPLDDPVELVQRKLAWESVL